METIHTIEWMKQVARRARAEGQLVGLVPTMGALHQGHAALISAARRDCSPVVVSIFVNPKQFGPGEDLARYPRPLEVDRVLLDAQGVDYLFSPVAAEIYPPGFRSYVEVEELGKRLEGRSRPGHFRGVATVVLKLFQIVQPWRAYLGRKDAQQARIIGQMAADLNLDTEVIVCPTVREADGLAMSSRNAYLKPDERGAATVLHRALAAARDQIATGERDQARLVAAMRGVIAEERLASADYVEIVDAQTFEPIVRLKGACLAVMAVFIGTIRLIDNMLIEEDQESLRVSL